MAIKRDGERQRVALVTGAATGIGLAIVKVLVGAGWRVYATAFPGQDTAGLASANVDVIEVDLTDAQSVAGLLKTVTREDRLDALVSNAGVAVPGPLEHVPYDQLLLQLEVNALAPMRLVQGLLPLIRSSGGRMVFMGAGQGRVALAFGGPYGASKSALAALTDSLRAEVAASGVSVTLVEPGAVRTGILESSRERALALLASLPADAAKRYEAPLLAMFERSDEAFQKALPPEKLARLIHRILVSPRPRPRYLVGTEARALAVAALLPATWRARLVARLGQPAAGR